MCVRDLRVGWFRWFWNGPKRGFCDVFQIHPVGKRESIAFFTKGGTRSTLCRRKKHVASFALESADWLPRRWWMAQTKVDLAKVPVACPTPFIPSRPIKSRLI